MSEVIYQDENGIETKRVVKGKGRPPKDAVRQENGDFIVRVGVVVPGAPKAEYIVPQYITVDATGTELVPRTNKGRGRAKPGFTKMEDGPFKGHWVMTQTVAPVEAPKAEVIVKTEEVVPA